jgi:transposase
MKKHIPSPKVRRDFLMPDALWEEIQPLLPKPPKTHPFGGGRPRVSDRRAMDAIFFVLRTGCQWNALNKTGLCSSSSAHRRFQEWVKAGVFLAIWRKRLTRYDELKGIDWKWQSLDGAMTKAPLSGKKMWPQPHRPRQTRGKTESAH